MKCAHPNQHLNFRGFTRWNSTYNESDVLGWNYPLELKRVSFYKTPLKIAFELSDFASNRTHILQLSTNCVLLIKRRTLTQSLVLLLKDDTDVSHNDAISQAKNFGRRLLASWVKGIDRPAKLNR